MGNMVQTEKANERRNMIYDLIKEEPGKEFKCKDLMSLFGITHTTLYKDIEYLKSRHKGSLEKSRGSICYVMNVSPKVEKLERYPDHKNNEGIR